jgi:hypothetical protein
MKKGRIIKTLKPEAKIQHEIIEFLTLRGWFCKVLHGSTFQVGMPDLFCCKRCYGSRFIEVKNPNGYRFTPAQMAVFPRLAAEGVGIWILTAATEEEYQKLFSPPNFWQYLHITNINGMK